MSGGKGIESTATTVEMQSKAGQGAKKRRHFNLYEDQQILKDHHKKEALVSTAQTIADLATKLDTTPSRIKERMRKLISLPADQKNLIIAVGGPNEEEWSKHPLVLLNEHDKLPIPAHKFFVYFQEQAPKAIRAITTTNHGQYSTAKALLRATEADIDQEQAMNLYMAIDREDDQNTSSVKSSMRSKKLSTSKTEELPAGLLEFKLPQPAREPADHSTQTDAYYRSINMGLEEKLKLTLAKNQKPVAGAEQSAEPSAGTIFAPKDPNVLGKRANGADLNAFEPESQKILKTNSEVADHLLHKENGEGKRFDDENNRFESRGVPSNHWVGDGDTENPWKTPNGKQGFSIEKASIEKLVLQGDQGSSNSGLLSAEPITALRTPTTKEEEEAYNKFIEGLFEKLASDHSLSKDQIFMIALSMPNPSFDYAAISQAILKYKEENQAEPAAKKNGRSVARTQTSGREALRSIRE